MEELKAVVAANITHLRTAEKMTQAELAERLSYSDKSVSKWERGEAIPDAYILKAMAEIFGVTVDYLLSPHDGKAPQQVHLSFSTRVITNIALIGIGLLALLVFIIFWILGQMLWIIFLYAIPVMLITLLVLHSLWENGRRNYLIIGALIVSLIATLYFTFLVFGGKNWWQLYLLLLPAETIVFLCTRLRQKREKPLE